MKKIIMAIGVFLLSQWVSPTLAQDYTPLSVDTLWQLERFGSPTISPDGQSIVVPITTFDVDTDKSSTQLWLYSANNKFKEYPLTSKGLSVSGATFSPDGQHLAFISRRDQDDSGQIYILPMQNPGEAVRLSQVPTGTYGIKWVGQHIYFISKVWPNKDWDENAEALKQKKATHVSAYQWNALPYAQFDHWLEEELEAHLFRISVTSGDVEPISQTYGLQFSRSSQGTGSYDVSPDERYVALVADSLNNGVSPDADIFLARLGSKEIKNITEDNRGGDYSPQFSPNGKTLVYQRQEIVGFYADKTRLYTYDIQSGKKAYLTKGWDRSVNQVIWTKDSKGFYITAGDNAVVRVYHINAKNGKRKALTSKTDTHSISVSRNGTLVGLNESFLHPAQLVSINTRNGSLTRLDTLNDNVLKNIDLGTYESVTYKGHNDDDIQMWVHYPPGFDKTKKYPFFLIIHGGPHSGITNSFHYRWNAQTFASWGYVTAWHNFHGSNTFGQDFTDSINPDWLTAPYADTIAAAEWFQNKPWIDSDRMVAGGGSYGGYLSSILLGKEHPFKALLIHAAVYNMYSQMSADFAVHGERFGYYWDKPELYTDISPHYFAENFNTPSLIIHGQKDLRVPVGQGFELFRTLQSRGVDSRMIYYPDENHWVLKPNNSIYWYNQVQDWFAKYAKPGAQ